MSEDADSGRDGLGDIDLIHKEFKIDAASERIPGDAEITVTYVDPKGNAGDSRYEFGPAPEAKEPREWLYVGNFISQSGEKYTILNGPEIGSRKVLLVEKSAYLQACKERDEMKNHIDICEHNLVIFQRERDEFKKQAEHNASLDAEMYQRVCGERDEARLVLQSHEGTIANLRAELDRLETQNQRLRVDSKLDSLLKCREFLSICEEALEFYACRNNLEIVGDGINLDPHQKDWRIGFPYLQSAEYGQTATEALTKLKKARGE